MVAGLIIGVPAFAAYFYFVYSNRKAILEIASHLKSRRFEPPIVLSFFSAAVLATPLGILPTGAMILVGVMIGYMYGYAGMILAWPGVACGMSLSFAIGRVARRCGSSSRSDEEGADEEAEALLPKESKVKTTSAGRLLKASQRLLLDEPKRIAIMLGLALPMSTTQFLLGAFTDIRFADAAPSFVVAALRQFLYVAQGNGLEDAADFARTGGDQENASERALSLSLNAVTIAAILVVSATVYRALNKEIERDQAEAVSEPPEPQNSEQ